MQALSKYPANNNKDYKFSIVIPTWNNLDYLKLCINSIKKNSYFEHQIIVHVNDGSDGTLEWIKNQNIDYTHSNENIGICIPLNFARTMVKTDYYVYMNDDMYVCPKWDYELWEVIKKKDNNLFFYSSTMIEPKFSNNDCVIAPKNYGTSIDTFDEEGLLADIEKLKKDDWSGATWPPNIVHIDLWDTVGGYSIEFSPGINSDPDFSKKLWDIGVRDFKGIGNSLVYHFMSKSTGKVKKNNGGKQFLLKWGITSGNFNRYVLKKGKSAYEALPEPSGKEYNKKLLLGKIKKIFSF